MDLDTSLCGSGRPWEKYLHQNSSEECDCQVVSAVNAYYHLTGRRIDQSARRYDRLRRLSGAVSGAAICIGKVHEKLGVRVAASFTSLICFPATLKFPVELAVWHKAYGYHSVLIVDHEPKTACFRITNFGKATNLHGWIFAEDLEHYISKFDRRGDPFKQLVLV